MLHFGDPGTQTAVEQCRSVENGSDLAPRRWSSNRTAAQGLLCSAAACHREQEAAVFCRSNEPSSGVEVLLDALQIAAKGKLFLALQA